MPFDANMAGSMAFHRIIEACLNGCDLYTNIWLAPNPSCPTSHINNGDEE